MARFLSRRLSQWAARRNAATAIEYGLLAGGIALAILVAVFLTGGSLSDLFSALADTMASSASKIEAGTQ
jgi:pilus assembly protein Flp/PilA